MLFVVLEDGKLNRCTPVPAKSGSFSDGRTEHCVSKSVMAQVSSFVVPPAVLVCLSWNARFLGHLEDRRRHPPGTQVDLVTLATMLSRILEGGITISKVLRARRTNLASRCLPIAVT